MDKLCDRLITTYNTTTLDDVDKFRQAVFLNEAEKHKDGSKGKKVLMDLIYNHYRKKKPMPAFIGGPMKLTMHWSDKYQKLFYIFGEFHDKNMDCKNFYDYGALVQGVGKKKTMEELRDGCKKGQVRNPKTKRCVKESGQIAKGIIEANAQMTSGEGGPSGEMPVEDFLEHLIMNTDAFIDLYLEFPAYKGEEYQKDPWGVLGPGGYAWDRLSTLLKRLNTCMAYAKRAAEKCRLARVHYLDVRKGDLRPDELNDTSWFRDIMKKKENKKITGLKMLVKNPRMKKILKAFTASKSDYAEFWRQQVLTNDYVTKELAKSYLENEIRDFVIKETVKEAMKVQNLIKTNAEKVLNPKNDDQFYDSFITMYERTVGPNARVTDAYALARMFKKFDVEKRAARGAELDQPEEPHNIIIYAGDAHSNTYRDFLKHIGFTTVAAVGSRYEQGRNCINMKGFPQPFFSYIPENKGFLAKLFGW